MADQSLSNDLNAMSHPISTQEIVGERRKPLDEQVMKNLSAISYTIDIFVNNLSIFTEEKQRYIIGIKDGSELFQSIIIEKARLFDHFNVESFNCVQELRKLLWYLNLGCVRLNIFRFTGFMTDEYVLLAKQMEERTEAIKAAFEEWEADMESLLKPCMKQVEDNLLLLRENMPESESDDAFQILDTLIDRISYFSDAIAVHFGLPPKTHALKKHYMSVRGIEADIASYHAELSETDIYNLNVLLSNPLQKSILQAMSKNLYALRTIWDTIKKTRGSVIGIAEFTMPKLDFNLES